MLKLTKRTEREAVGRQVGSLVGGALLALAATCVLLSPAASVAQGVSLRSVVWNAMGATDPAPRYTAPQARMASDLRGCPTLPPSFLGMNGAWALDIARDGWQKQATGSVVLCSDYFASIYSPVTRTPLYVIEKLNAAQLADAKDETRSREFFEDPRIRPATAPSLADYRSSGYDRGHLSPAANQPHAEAMLQSFVLTNVAPQDPHFNQRIWSKVESDVRKYARRIQTPIYVLTGVLFADPEDALKPAAKTMYVGDGVWVPSHFFKVVVDPSRSADPDKGVWGWVMPNGGARMGEPLRGQALMAAGVPAALVRGAMSEGKFEARRAGL